MGRRPFDISQWKVEKIGKNKYKCTRCDYIISGSVTRVRAHSEGEEGKGVIPCPFAGKNPPCRIPKQIFQAASVNISNKRAKTVVNAREEGNKQFIQFLQPFFFFFPTKSLTLIVYYL